MAVHANLEIESGAQVGAVAVAAVHCSALVIRAVPGQAEVCPAGMIEWLAVQGGR